MLIMKLKCFVRAKEMSDDDLEVTSPRPKNFYQLISNHFHGSENIPNDVKRKNKSLFSRLKNNRSKISKRNKLSLIDELINDEKALFFKARIELNQDSFAPSFYYKKSKNLDLKVDEKRSHEIYSLIWNRLSLGENIRIGDIISELNISDTIAKLVLLRLHNLGFIVINNGAIRKTYMDVESFDEKRTSLSQKLRISKSLTKLRQITLNNKVINHRLIFIKKENIEQIKVFTQEYYDKIFDRFYNPSGGEFEAIVTFNRCTN